jgi:hypothetical protein
VSVWGGALSRRPATDPLIEVDAGLDFAVQRRRARQWLLRSFGGGGDDYGPPI